MTPPRLLAAVLLLAAIIVPVRYRMSAQPPTNLTVGGVPLFGTWPKDQKPDAVILLSGQTFGYLRPCGCSVNQKGGLERRANLIASLKAQGWPVVAADLGDVSAPKSATVDQNRLKYKTAMTAMREMGYVAVGLGVYDFDAPQLMEQLSAFTYQNEDKPPTVLAANLVGIDSATRQQIPREKQFPPAAEGGRPAVEDIEVITVGDMAVGFTLVIGKDVQETLRKVDANFEYQDVQAVLTQVVQKLAAHPKKPAVNVLLYQGSKDHATKIAAAFPQFQVILCLSGTAESEPNQFPTPANAGKTLIVQVGHKGQNVGLVGAFKTDKGIELKYQLVPLPEDFVTPADQVKDHKVIALLEKYAAEVKDRDLLALFTANPSRHATQTLNPQANLTFVGSEACIKCHAGEGAVWRESKHSHAMEALEKIADRPKNRQFDGECVVCHSVGFGLVSGHINDEKTPHLRHVGCESCHGPGSGHAADPKDKKLLLALSQWKSEKPEAQLPAKADLERLAAGQEVQLTLTEKQTLNAVGTMCLRCHDTENDPKFDVNKSMPKIWHSGLTPKVVGK